MTLEALPQSPDQKCPVRGGCSRYYSVQFQVPPFITMKSGNLIQLLYFREKKKRHFLELLLYPGKFMLQTDKVRGAALDRRYEQEK